MNREARLSPQTPQTNLGIGKGKALFVADGEACDKIPKSCFMIREYIQAAMEKAVFKTTGDPESVFGEIPPCPGVWATGNTIEDCRKVLEEVLEGWILLGIRLGHSLPEIDGIRIEVPEISSVP